MTERCSQEQLSAALELSHAATWQEAANYLLSYGDNVPGLSQEQRAAMLEDLLELQERNAPFTTDADVVYPILSTFHTAARAISPGPAAADNRATPR